MRVYISGQISGVDDYKNNFRDAGKFLLLEKHEVIDPTAFDGILPKLTYEEYMKFDLALLDLCDAIYMLKGWEKSLGANREYGYALAAGKHIMMEE